ncbi:MAG: hypothetical protein QXR30_03865 [Candidatus Woesearchaeota archaeon]
MGVIKLNGKKFFEDYYKPLINYESNLLNNFAKKISENLKSLVYSELKEEQYYKLFKIKLPIKPKDTCKYLKISKPNDFNIDALSEFVDAKKNSNNSFVSIKITKIDFNNHKYCSDNVVEDNLKECYNAIINILQDDSNTTTSVYDFDERECLYIKGKKYRFVFWEATNYSTSRVDINNGTNISVMNNFVYNIEKNFDDLFDSQYNEDYVAKLIRFFNSLNHNCLIIELGKKELFYNCEFNKRMFNIFFTKNFLFENSSNFPNILSFREVPFNDHLRYSYKETYNCDIFEYYSHLFKYHYSSNFVVKINSNSFTSGIFGSKYSAIFKILEFKVDFNGNIYDLAFDFEICFTNYHDLNPKNIFGGGILNFVKFSSQNLRHTNLEQVLFYKHVDRFYNEEKYQVLNNSIIIDYSDTKKLMNNLSGPAFIGFHEINGEKIIDYEFSIDSVNLKEDEFLKKLCEIYNNDEFPLEKFLMKYFC